MDISANLFLYRRDFKKMNVESAEGGLNGKRYRNRRMNAEVGKRIRAKH
jgi:hypothetical protein